MPGGPNTCRPYAGGPVGFLSQFSNWDGHEFRLRFCSLEFHYRNSLPVHIVQQFTFIWAEGGFLGRKEAATEPSPRPVVEHAHCFALPDWATMRM